MERKPLINLNPLFLSSTLLTICSMTGFADLALATSKMGTLNVLEEQPIIDATITKAKLDKIPDVNTEAPKSIETSNSKQQTTNYLPYLQIEGSRLFHTANSKAAIGTDLFIPFGQDRNNLVFTDLRTYDPSGKAFEGNLHFGYRCLSPDEYVMYGIYGAFDRKRTSLGNYFNQLTFGGELWINRLFIGANLYHPIGKNSKNTTHSTLDNGLWLSTDKTLEKAVPGIDAEIGYDLTNSITAYAGGYYYHGKNMGSKYGPKARITYDLSLDNGRIFGVLDKVGLEAGVQHDKPLGTVWYLSTNVRVGWLPKDKPDLQGVARHMVDPIRRDANITTLVNHITKVMPNSITTPVSHTLSEPSNKESTPKNPNINSGESSVIVFQEDNIEPTTSEGAFNAFKKWLSSNPPR